MSKFLETLAHDSVAELTAAVLAKVDVKIPLDPEVKDPQTIALVNMAWGVQKCFYDVIARSVGSAEPGADGWRRIPSDAIPSIAASLAQGLSGQGPLANIVGAIAPTILSKLGIGGSSLPKLP